MTVFKESKLWSFIFVVILSLFYGYAYTIIKRKQEAGEEIPSLRSFSFVDAIDEQIGRATELGRPLGIYIHGGIGVAGGGAACTMVALHALFDVASKCARMGIRFMVFPGKEPVINMARQYLIDAYTAEGKLDELDEEYTIRFIQGRHFGSKDMRMVHTLWEENISCLMAFGTSGTCPQQLQAHAPRIGATVLGMGMTWSGAMYAGVYGDYSLVGEEVTAYGAQITKDPAYLGCTYSQDWTKYIVLSMIVVGWLLVNGGSSLIVNMLKV